MARKALLGLYVVIYAYALWRLAKMVWYSKDDRSEVVIQQTLASAFLALFWLLLLVMPSFTPGICCGASRSRCCSYRSAAPCTRLSSFHHGAVHHSLLRNDPRVGPRTAARSAVGASHRCNAASRAAHRHAAVAEEAQIGLTSSAGEMRRSLFQK